MSRQLFFPSPFVLMTLLIPTLFIMGCGNVTEEARQNRRLVDAVLTAVTTKNRKELVKDQVLIDKRFADNLISDKSYKQLKSHIQNAQSGNWTTAEQDLYVFREANPFPK